jgi:hypothetical protein
MLQRVQAEVDYNYRLDVCRVTKGWHIQHLWGVTKNWRVYLSISRPWLQHFSAIQVYRFYEMCQGITDNPVNYAVVYLYCACDLLLFVFYQVRVVRTFFFKFFFVLNTRNERSSVKQWSLESNKTCLSSV